MSIKAQMGSYRTFSGQNVLITGSTRGIGLAVAHAFNNAGAHVVIHGRSASPEFGLTETFAELEAVRYVGGDLSEPTVRRELIKNAGPLHHLINNAAIQYFGELAQTNTQAFEETLATNVVALADLMKLFVQNAASQKGLSIVNIASTRSWRPGVGMATYSASKAAVASLTQSAAAELGPKGIRVNAISPGLIERPNLRKDWPEGVSAFEECAPLKRIGQPEDIAAACLFLSSTSAAWITGQNIIIDGGITLVR